MRLRTTALAVVLVALTLGLGSWGLIRAVQSRLEDELFDERDAGIEYVAGQVDAGVEPAEAVENWSVGPIEFEIVPVPATDGETAAVATEIADSADDVDALFGGAETRFADGDPYPAVEIADGDPFASAEAEPVLFVAESPEGEVTFSAGVSLVEVNRSVETLSRYLRFLVPLVVAGVGCLTWLLTGRALRPVERMRRVVDEISHTSLHRRIEPSGAGDEVGALATTMNDMLERLELAAERQHQFVSNASHEFRSPLSTIRTSMEVASRADSAVGWEQASDVVLSEVARLDALVADLLYTARANELGDTTTIGDIDLDELVLAELDRIAAVGRAASSSNVAAARVRGDRHALSRLVRNLVDNADRHAATSVAVSLQAAGDVAVLCVDDDGPGIPAADRERVFERFARLDDGRARDKGGAGLGLALARSIVEAHHGTIRADAAPLGGARLEVRLPFGR